MATGDLTCTYVGNVDSSGAAFTILDAGNTGAATAGADTKSYVFVNIGNQCFCYLIARSA